MSCSKIVTVPVVRNAQDTLSSAINHFNYSAKRVECLKHRIIEKSGPTQQKKLLTLCTTRFVERHTAVVRFWDCYPSIIAALEDMEEWSDREASSKSYSIRTCLEKSETLIGLACLKTVSALMKPLSRALQGKSGDLVRALRIIENTKAIITEMRSNSENSFKAVFDSARDIANELNVEIVKPRLSARSNYRASAAMDMDVSSYYRVNVYIPLLDAILSDFNDRFSSHFAQNAALSTLVPSLILEKTWDDLIPAVKKYSSFLSGTETEVITTY